MKYRVSGSNRETGARMTLEFEAESKAAAERKALQQMNVNHVQDITDGAPPDEMAARAGAGRGKGGMPVVVKLLILIIILAGVGYFLWPRIHGMLHY